MACEELVIKIQQLVFAQKTLPCQNNPKMSDEILRYTDLAALIQMAKARGWSNERIVREISTGMTYADALNLARKAAPLLDLTISEFMKLRKNE